MGNSKDEKISPADEIKCISKYKDEMIVADYNETMASMRKIVDMEHDRENKDKNVQDNLEK